MHISYYTIGNTRESQASKSCISKVFDLLQRGPGRELKSAAVHKVLFYCKFSVYNVILQQNSKKDEFKDLLQWMLSRPLNTYLRDKANDATVLFNGCFVSIHHDGS